MLVVIFVILPDVLINEFYYVTCEIKPYNPGISYSSFSPGYLYRDMVLVLDVAVFIKIFL